MCERVGVAHDGWLYVLQPGGIHHFKGTGSGVDKYYCARRLGTALIPGSDGQCGPNNGPQCAECRAYQAAQVGSLGLGLGGALVPFAGG